MKNNKYNDTIDNIKATDEFKQRLIDLKEKDYEYTSERKSKRRLIAFIPQMAAFVVLIGLLSLVVINIFKDIPDTGNDKINDFYNFSDEETDIAALLYLGTEEDYSQSKEFAGEKYFSTLNNKWPKNVETVENYSWDIYLLVPKYENMTITIHALTMEEKDGYEEIDGYAEYYDPEPLLITGNPVLLKCNGSDIWSSLLVIIEYNNEKIDFAPFLSLKGDPDENAVIATDGIFTVDIMKELYELESLLPLSDKPEFTMEDLTVGDFKYNDGISMEQIETVFGKAASSNEWEEGATGNIYTEYTYSSGNIFSFMHHFDNETPMLTSVFIKTEGIKTARGLGVGSSLTDVIASFKNENINGGILYVSNIIEDENFGTIYLPPKGEFYNESAEDERGINVVYTVPAFPYDSDILEEPSDYVFWLHGNIYFNIENDVVVNYGWNVNTFAE